VFFRTKRNRLRLINLAFETVHVEKEGRGGVKKSEKKQKKVREVECH